VRLEQIHPFHHEAMAALLARYAHVTDIVWCQEEPKNMGAWMSVQPNMLDVLQSGQRLRYVGRSASASPATGSAKVHEREQDALLSEATA
jgi:2-oxoglutarate dehydrogenase E1 component